MKAIINSHIHKVANPKTITKDRTCNCVDKAKCTLSKNCLLKNILYKAVSTSIHTTKKKSTSAQLKLRSSCGNQTIKEHLNF